VDIFSIEMGTCEVEGCSQPVTCGYQDTYETGTVADKDGVLWLMSNGLGMHYVCINHYRPSKHYESFKEAIDAPDFQSSGRAQTKTVISLRCKYEKS
jgi:hypothetical protein